MIAGPGGLSVLAVVGVRRRGLVLRPTPGAELAALQLHRLKQTVERAYARVPTVRRKLDRAGVAPDAIKTLRDMERLPFTTKADLRDNFPFGLFAVPREELLRLHASSGTTGKPTVVGYTRADLDLWSELMARSE